MGRFLGTLINGVIDLLSNNNVRLAILWLFIIGHGIFNCAVVGFGPAATPSYESMSVERKEALQSLNPKVFDDSDPIGEKFRFWSWLFWFVELAAGGVYTPIAFLDEAKRQARKAMRPLREDRGRMPPPSAQPLDNTLIQRKTDTFWHKILWLTEVTEMVTHFFGKRG